MKRKVFSLARLAPLALIVLLLTAGVVPAAMAQGPDDEGDVGAAYTFHGDAALVPNPLIVDLTYGGTSDLVIYDIEDVAAADLVVDFTAGLPPNLSVTNVQPGDLLRGLVLGRDYQFQFCEWGPNQGGSVPVCAGDPDATIALVPVTGDQRLSISLFLFPHVDPLRGNGSLARITWGAAGIAGVDQPLTWQKGDFRDREGNQIPPCGALPGPPLPGCTVAGAFPVGGLVNGEVADQAIRGEVSFEGGKPASPCPLGGGPNCPTTNVTWKDSVNAGTCPFDASPTPDSHFECPAAADPAIVVPVTVEVKRDGYLGAKATNFTGLDLPNVTLLAGNVVVTGGACEIINIADLAAIAGQLNQPAAGQEQMDFNNNNTVDIGDLALAAKNYGKAGVMDWFTGALSCP